MKRVFAILVMITLAFGLISVSGAGAYADASVPAGYTAVNDAMDLWDIRNNMSGKFILTADIDLTAALAVGGDLYNAKGWVSPGYAAAVANAEPFTGLLDGNGYTIKGLSSSSSACGLFFRNNGTIKNLTLEGGEITNAVTAGAVAVHNYGTIENCHSSVNITETCTETAYLGGIVAQNYAGAVIRDCSNSGNISLTNTKEGEYRAVAGGIAGTNLGIIDRVWNTGSISVSSYSFWNYNSGGGYHSAAGGIVGRISASSGQDIFTVSNAYNTGTVFSENKKSYQAMSYAGGIVGYFSPGSCLVSKCYNVGSVEAVSKGDSNHKQGGIVGCFSSNSIVDTQFVSCYYLNNTERGVGNHSTSPCVSTSAALMKRQSTFSGFDFDTVWEMGTGDYLYPVIRHAHTLNCISAVEESCTKDGNIEYWYCRMCGRLFADANASQEISQADTVVPAAHKYTERVVAPVCTAEGYTVHSCSRCGNEYRDSYVAALGHDYRDTILAPTCTAEGYTVHDCSRCGAHTVDSVVAALGHDYHDTVTAPTCTEGGFTAHDCSRCGDHFVDSYTAALGHDWSEWTAISAASCTEGGEESRDCSRCDAQETRRVEALGHDYQDSVTAPTCTEGGYTTHACDRCGDHFVDSFTEALGHDYRDIVTAPTCTEGGYTTHACDRCGNCITDSYTDPIGHEYDEPSWIWSDDCSAASAVFACVRGDDSTALEATITKAGSGAQAVYSAKVKFNGKVYLDKRSIRLHINSDALSVPVFDSALLELLFDSGFSADAVWTSSNETVATVDEDGVVTALKYGRTTVTGEAYGISLSCEVQTLFYDVTDPSKYYFPHVYWAAENGITKGYQLEYFAPERDCSREEMMTFLWRMAGKPEPRTTTSKFSDVEKGAYYYKAVLWGVEQGITNGYSTGEYAGKFGVGLPCTREQAMTFLWRLAGKPEPASTTNKFSDMKSSDYFYKAVLWASENKIANGYSSGEYAGMYGVGLACLREHMVTFLSRYASKFMS